VDKKTKKRMAVEMLALLAIYIVWGAIIAFFNLHRKIGDDSLIPCLFFLPPLSLFTAYIIIIRLIWWAVKILKQKDG